jgi:hypothetical protein
MLLLLSATRRDEDAGDRLSPSWRSVLRSSLLAAGRQPDDVVESTGCVLLSMDDDGDRPLLSLHSAMLPARGSWLAIASF